MMKMRFNSGIFFMASLLAIFLFSAQDLNAQRGRAKAKTDWDQLGSRLVSKGADHDVIELNKRDGLYTKLKFKVAKSRVHIDNIKVVFQNGDVENVRIDRNFNVGEWSSVIDLVGNKRFIDKIIFNYHTKFFADGRGKIIVFGKN
jgi:hypothetical protein